MSAGREISSGEKEEKGMVAEGRKKKEKELVRVTIEREGRL